MKWPRRVPVHFLCGVDRGNFLRNSSRLRLPKFNGSNDATWILRIKPLLDENQIPSGLDEENSTNAKGSSDDEDTPASIPSQTPMDDPFSDDDDAFNPMVAQGEDPFSDSEKILYEL